MSVRRATLEDLPKMQDWATEFYASSKHLNGFQLERFIQFWTAMLNSGAGVIFVVTESNAQGEVIVGAICGMAHADIYSGDMIASEFAWRVRERSRGAGVRLYYAFENWAREQGCKTIQMVHLSEVMPEKVAKFYLRLGYEAIETRYSKSLKQAAQEAA